MTGRVPPADVALVGPYPPPYGGISVHLLRLGRLLDRGGVSWHQYNTYSAAEAPGVTSVRARRVPWLSGVSLSLHERLIHVHGVDHLLARANFLPLAARRPVAYSFHNSLTLAEAPTWRRPQRVLLRALLRSAALVHVVNPEQVALAVDLGARPDRVHAYPAFLPPDRATAPPLPEAIPAWLARRSPSLVAVGDPKRTFGGASMYGFDLMLDLLDDLRGDYPDAGVLVFLTAPTPTDARGRTALDHEATARGVGDMVRVVQLDLECWPAFALADLMIRPTRTDGDAVAVREALALGVPVVASAVGKRPEATVLFPSGSGGAFIDAVRSVVRNPSGARARLACSPVEDPSDRILALYRGLLG